jgi:protein YibB
MEPITLVTAFFDIGRKNYLRLSRDNSKYLNNFKFWARIKNNLIIYTSKDFSDEIMNIRKSFDLGDKTKIVIIDDLKNIEPDILNSMSNVSSNKYFLDFRLLRNATSNIPQYSYLMLLKTWFVNDAVKRELTSEKIAWIDFGFNHGGSLYTHPEDFDFEWNFNFEEKIHLFYYKSIDKKPIFETVRRLNDSIMGCLIYIPKKYASTLWNLNKESMKALNKVGLSDDDQLIQLMSLREKPEIFSLYESDWFLPLKQYGGTHLRTKILKKKFILLLLLSKIRLKFLKRKKVLEYIKITKKNLLKEL